MNDRLAQNEIDPNKLLSQVLGGEASQVNMASSAYLNGKLLAFPKTDEARDRFIAAGYSLESVTPTMSGFDLQKSVRR